MELLLPILTTAVSVGLSCGTCCSPTVSIFLSTYIISHSGGMKKSILSFISFVSGKITSVILICAVAAALGNQFIDDSGYLGNINLQLVMQISMIGLGIILIGKWIIDAKNPNKNCSSCSGEKKIDAKGIVPLFMAGFTYGATPCSPLILMIGLCATLSVSSAILVGFVFTLASTLTPVLLMVLISGVLSGRMKKEIPQYIRWFQLASYILITVLSFNALSNL
ncbi:sulfite exporter TauE/SafE family protein [Eubacteriaceae bacterium ES3]|nr:sulfite exporter TauE/SafE family protein [Eubacteriaceae bacterium ES3]